MQQGAAARLSVGKLNAMERHTDRKTVCLRDALYRGGVDPQTLEVPRFLLKLTITTLKIAGRFLSAGIKVLSLPQRI